MNDMNDNPITLETEPDSELEYSDEAIKLSSMLSKATGRKAALAVIDKIMGDACNIHHFERTMQEAFTMDPYTFFRQIVMPLTPKQVMLSNNIEENKIQINITMIDKNACVQSANVEEPIDVLLQESVDGS